jgi:hypothetical protein
VAKRLGSRIVCDLVLGEWDYKNRLRGVPHMTWDEAGWDAAAVVEANRPFFEQTFDVLEGSEFLEYAPHGLLHGYYENGQLVHERFLYPFLGKDEHGRTVPLPVPTEELDRMLELYFEIYRDWGFKKPLRLFTPGNGAAGIPSDENNCAFARILKKHGIGIFQWGGWKNPIEVHEGVLFPASVHFSKIWNGYDMDADYLPDCFETKNGYRPVPNPSGHLTNFIRFHHQKNFEYVDKWVNYFRRLTAPFGVMLSAGNPEAASQTLYAEYASLDRVEGGYRIDLAPVDAIRTDMVGDELFVSIRGNALPRACTGGEIFVHEHKKDHTIYKIVRDGSPVVTVAM